MMACTRLKCILQGDERELDKHPKVEGTLVGIKGQYWLFEDGRVWNVRAHTSTSRLEVQLSDGSLGALAMWVNPSPMSEIKRFQYDSFSSSVLMMFALSASATNHERLRISSCN